ncbi:MAG: endonuclease III [Candidatus Eremiobacteraeota bacterium]|nr:endonuclease III [Candidatus Eremiobacteraeota bacterium]
MIPFPKRKVSRETAQAELDILERTYPNAVTALQYTNPFELLVAVTLSAQTTDARVNMTTPTLFEKYPHARALAEARQEDVEEIVKSTGFFRQKSKNIIATARELVEKYDAQVPREREQLEALPGVGRKTANVVMSVAFEEEAIAVDTHVFRVSHRLGLTTGKMPRDVENDLMKLVPREKWRHAHHWLILHGRAICKAPTPLCGACPVKKICPTPPIIAKMTTEKVRAKKSTAPSGRDAADATAPRRKRSS